MRTSDMEMRKCTMAVYKMQCTRLLPDYVSSTVADESCYGFVTNPVYACEACMHAHGSVSQPASQSGALAT
jgi:hypothetical protein